MYVWLQAYVYMYILYAETNISKYNHISAQYRIYFDEIQYIFSLENVSNAIIIYEENS